MMLKLLLVNVDRIGKKGQFVAYLILGLILFGSLAVIGISAGEDMTIAWLSAAIGMTAWTIGLAVWLGRRKEAQKPGKDMGTNPS